jgi:LysM repeat protein
VAKLEKASASDESEAMRSRIASLESTVANLRKELANQRGEIVKDLSSRLAKMPQPEPAQTAKSAETSSSGPYREYEVASGDTLWLIAKAFNTSVQKIRDMNNLKSDSLKVGQKLKIPAE